MDTPPRNMPPLWKTKAFAAARIEYDELAQQRKAVAERIDSANRRTINPRFARMSREDISAAIHSHLAWARASRIVAVFGTVFAGTEIIVAGSVIGTAVALTGGAVALGAGASGQYSRRRADVARTELEERKTRYVVEQCDLELCRSIDEKMDEAGERLRLRIQDLDPGSKLDLQTRPRDLGLSDDGGMRL